MSSSWAYLAADYYAWLELVAAVVTGLIIVSAIDDIAIDVSYWVIKIRRYFMWRDRPHSPLTSEQLLSREEQPIAIMVPAWMEYDVIAAMIENMAGVMNYRNYTIFVGTYINDPPTIQEVERMRRRYKHLHRVEVPHAGPTCKADCLNWIIQAIFLHERTMGISFAGVILHDSEDVLHPLELKFFNYLLPRIDLIQLPVLSLERQWYELVAGTYMDEFAESHGKDMTVREALCGVVPSAGVGTCFSRRALVALCEETQNQPFNTRSLTEDYDIGNRLAQMGMRCIFAVFPVQFLVKRTRWRDGQASEPKTITLPLCVREYFPDTFRTAYRQKARWALGIGLQSWDQLAFRGGLAARYFMLRDKKGILTSLISIVAYVLLAQFLIFQLAALAGWWTQYYPPRFAYDGVWHYALLFNMAALVNRIFHRMYFVSLYYGWHQGVLSVPRMIVSNFVNFMAVSRAWKLYLSYLFRGKAMVWDKTMHDFPSADSLVVKKQRLGELLQSWQALDADRLNEALAAQKELALPLGQVLISNGWLDDETLAEAIAFQSDLPRITLKPEDFLPHADLLNPSLRARWRVIPLGPQSEGHHRVAVAGPLPSKDRQELRSLLGGDVTYFIGREGEIQEALHLLNSLGQTAQGSLPAPHNTSTPLLGEILVKQGWIERETFELALRTYRPQRDGRLGDYLVREGVISHHAVQKALILQKQAPSIVDTAGEPTKVSS